MPSITASLFSMVGGGADATGGNGGGVGRGLDGGGAEIPGQAERQALGGAPWGQAGLSLG